MSDWVSLLAQVIGYQSVLRYLAVLSGIALGISLFIGRRLKFSVLDPLSRPVAPAAPSTAASPRTS